MRVVVSGVTAGIGRAISARLVREGHTVIGIGRRDERLTAMRSELGAAFVGVRADVGNHAELVASLADVLRPGDPVDALVNNAGTSAGLGLFAETGPADWQEMIDTNVRGVLNLTSRCLPHLVAAGASSLVQIGSVSGRHAYRGGNVYGATKAFVHMLGEHLQVELADSGVRVTCVVAGRVHTDFARVRFGGDEDAAARFYAEQPPLEPGDIADAVLFALTAPANVVIRAIEILPAGQNPGSLTPSR